MTTYPPTTSKITAVLRTIAPSPVRLGTRRVDGGWQVRIAHTTAGHMAAGTPRGDAWLSAYLTGRLSQPVHVAEVRQGRPDVRGRSTFITIRPGPAPALPTLTEALAPHLAAARAAREVTG